MIFPFLRSVWDKKAAASPFLREPYGKLGALAQKRGFACASIIFRDPSSRILQGSRKSQRSEIFGKEERQAKRARRQAQRTACHGALARRAQDDRKRALLLRMTKGGLALLAQGDRRRQSILPFILNFTFYILHSTFTISRGDSSADKKRAKGAAGRRESGSAAGEVQSKNRGEQASK